MIRKPLGGERIGAGQQMNVDLKTFNRSTHDLSTIKRTTMAPGVIVPVYCNFAQNGDTWDGNIQAQVNTLPAIGPLFGSFKFAVDVFTAQVRNYNQWTTFNKLNVGMQMAQVKLPQVNLNAYKYDTVKDNQQIGSSSIFRYLGIAGIGTADDSIDVGNEYFREFNAIPFLVYWDIVKNYYINKQEDEAYVIHSGDNNPTTLYVVTPPSTSDVIPQGSGSAGVTTALGQQLNFVFSTAVTSAQLIAAETIILNTNDGDIRGTDIFTTGASVAGNSVTFTLDDPTKVGILINYYYPVAAQPIHLEPFDVTNIDQMREDIMANSGGTPFIINKATYAPYGLPMQTWTDESGNKYVANQFSQEGLAVKTYQNDLLNNWIKTEVQQYISDTSAISTLSGSITVDQIIMAYKVFDVLNRVAVSGGSYEDWEEVTYTSETQKTFTTPIYHGGLIKEIVFQEISSTAATNGEPLGQLAGKGRFSSKHKGGRVMIKPKTWSVVMAMAHITPRIDYSQGNTWWTHLQTMDDFHKPGLDQIGFQDLITEQMAASETSVNSAGIATVYSAGKQPAWVNYMTDIHYNYGAFAEPDNEMFMVLNRRYEIDPANGKIVDLTTYIDPSKYNYIFADTRLDAQNFWIQLGFNWEVRRVISAKQIPNL